MTIVKNDAGSEGPAQPAVKLPLAVRKSLRDNFESKLDGFNKALSDAMLVPWQVSIDVGRVWSHAEEEYARNNFGGLLSSYIEAAVRNVIDLTEKYGEDGRNELNAVASQHVITLEPSEDPSMSYNGCDIDHGKLRVLFKPTYLGTNIDKATYELPDRLSKAGELAATDKGPNLQARYSIRTKYDAEIPKLLAEARTALAMPSLKFNPNFAANFAMVAEFSSKSPGQLSSNWEHSFGDTTLEYFAGFVENLRSEAFAGDDMLQEGFADVVTSAEVALRVVDKLKSKTYNEPIIEDAVFYMSTVPNYWRTNTQQASYKIIDLL